MNKSIQNQKTHFDTAADQWLLEWVEESVKDFDNINFDEFILID